VNEKLKDYSEALKGINRLFGRKSLSELNSDETSQLIEQIQHTTQLTTKNKNFRIDGFKISYLSALLCSFFPNLIPIIDRRILYGIGLESRIKLNSQKQVINMIELYPDLIKQMQILLRSDEETKSIRELDKELFIKKLPHLV
jgi:hypothetical protein